jgi:hypothetical protein
MRFPGTRRAVTLIEAVLFIAIALGLIVGGLVFFQQARTASRTQDLVRLTAALVAEARSMDRMAGHFDSSANIGEILFKAGAVPAANWDPDLLPDAGIVTVDGVELIIIEGLWLDETGGFSGVGDSRGFSIQVQRAPKEVCSRVLSFDCESGAGVLGSGIAFVWVFGGDSPAFYSRRFEPNFGFTYTSANYPGLTPADAGEFCKRYDGRFLIGFFFDG